MNTYLINIATVARKDDQYNEVVTNLFPIIIRTYNEEMLKNHLIKLSEKVKNTLKTKYLYENSKFYIRDLAGNEFIWSLPEIVKLSY